jgi:alpha-1,3-rhamnosyl/mannosyltransferase
MPLRVGIDATTWWNDRGFGRFTRDLVGALCARNSGFEYTLVIDRPPDTSLPRNVQVISAAAGRTLTEAAVGVGARGFRDMWRIQEQVRRARFDVFFFPAVYSYFPLLSRTPCIVAFHDTIAERYPAMVFPTARNHLLWQAKTTLAKLQCRRAMTVSQASARDLHCVLGIAAERIDVVMPAADPVFRKLDDAAGVAQVRARAQVPEGAPLIVYVGGLNRHKNLLGLLRAWHLVARARPDVHLVIVGDTSGTGFYDYAQELMLAVQTAPELRSRVHFPGQLSDPEVVQLLNGSTGLILPSFLEGFGLPAVEAMQVGVPVLASRIECLTEVVADAGLYFDPHSPDEMAGAIVQLVDDTALHERLCAAARRRAPMFSWARAAELAEQSFLRCAQPRAAISGGATAAQAR